MADVKKGMHNLRTLERHIGPPPLAGQVPKPSLPEQSTIYHVEGMAAPKTSVSTDPGQRYQQLRFHAKGGQSEGHIALDTKLNREVALKKVQDRFQNDSSIRQRFLREAEITARLEHPGVVPVHDLIEGADGEPSYAMRFIQGKSLRDTVAEFHAADKPDRDPGERGLAIRQLLQRFVAVCNTVAYAHSRGIIYRDLKPANIMLRRYGETLVVDWGLGKFVGRDRTPARRASEGDVPDESTLAPTRGLQPVALDRAQEESDGDVRSPGVSLRYTHGPHSIALDRAPDSNLHDTWRE